MKAISIRQPYAWLVVGGHKPIENRTWNTNYRGPLAIHAPLKTHDHPLTEIAQRHHVAIDPTALEFGGIIGHVDLIDVVISSPSPWFTGPFGFVFANPRPCPFIPTRGQQSLFNTP